MRPLALLLPLLLLAGCRPLYLPPVPEPLASPPLLVLDGDLGLLEGRPALELRLARLHEEGWLAVQWFAPSNREVASQSVWLSQDDVGRTMIARLPEEIEPIAGRWRAVLSHRGVIVRQLSLEVPEQ